MASILFADVLRSSLDLATINRYFIANRKKTEEVLLTVRPEGRIEGNRFKMASAAGGQGGSFDYNFTNGHNGDWGINDHRHGVIGFLTITLKCSPIQAVKFLVDKKFLDKAEAKKAMSEADGDPLVLPIPETMQDWSVVLESDALRKDRGILKDYWTYKDTDGSLLGYKYRVDERRTNKEVYTLTYRAQSGWTKKEWQPKLIPPYGLEDLLDGPTVRILFVEGEKARDKAKEMVGDRWKVLSFSGVRGSDSLWLPDHEVMKDVEVVIWPDNDIPGKESARKLQLALEDLENKPREIRIVRVDQLAVGKGWDLGDWDEASGIDVAVCLERAEEMDSFERISRDWVYVTQPDMFYNLEDRGLVWSTVAFDRRYSRYGGKSESPSKKFLSSLESHLVDDLEFIPGESTFVRTAQGKIFLNEWYPTEVYAKAQEIAADDTISDAVIAENARCFIAHLKRLTKDNPVEPDKDPETGEIVPGTENRTAFDALALYFSNLIKRPMDKQGWVPMLLSAKNGTGKSVLKRIVGEIHGGNRVTTINVPEYIGQFHDWKDGILFYELGEAKDQESTTAYEELKKNHNYITFDFSQAADRNTGAVKLNIKTRGMKKQRDFLNGFVTSNSLFPLNLSAGESEEGGDRRLLVIRCETVLTQQESIDLIDDEMHNRAHWIGAWLMRFKPEFKWNPSWAPVTDHKRAMFVKDRERTENKRERFQLGKYEEFFQFVNYGKTERRGCFAKKAYTSDQIREFCDARRIRYPYEIGRFEEILEKAGIFRGPVVKHEGEQLRLYSDDLTMKDLKDSDWKKIAIPAHANAPL